MRNRILVLLLFSTLATGAPQFQFSERIVGGSLAADGEFPYVASIQISRSHICAGFVYNEKWILTTASCLNGRVPGELDVLVGVTSFITPTSEQQNIPVLSIVSHPDYDSSTKLNDIALVSLSRPIVFGSMVKSVAYDEANYAAPTADMAGWGSITDGGIESTRLRKTTLTITTSCPDYSANDYKYDFMICAGSVSSSPCQFDEGSPLVQSGVVIGVMSKNKGCAGSAPYIPSIFTRISPYYYWIDNIAGQQIGQTTTPSADTTITTTSTTASTTTIESTYSTKPAIPTAPCINCETPSTPTPTTIKPMIPTAPCVNCETPPSSTTLVKPNIPTAPCIGCVGPIPFIFKRLA